jgi:hypothetical protein
MSTIHQSHQIVAEEYHITGWHFFIFILKEEWMENNISGSRTVLHGVSYNAGLSLDGKC